MSLGCASIHIIFYNVSPSSNHNAFSNFLSGYNALHILDKMDRNRLLKDNTSLEAVTLSEESNNEVFKLLNYEYIQCSLCFVEFLCEMWLCNLIEHVYQSTSSRLSCLSNLYHELGSISLQLKRQHIFYSYM